MAEPEQILLSSLHDANATLQAIKAQLSDLSSSTGAVNPAVLGLIGDWLDRVARIGKVVVDGELSERLEKRLGWVAKDRAEQLFRMFAATLEAAPLSAQDRLLLWNSVEPGLHLIADERVPFRLSDYERRRFTDSLRVAAAKEQAVADGITWGDDESESDAGGELVLFPSVAGDGELV
jgi:hypothetical protein